jgi:hypothetical protein
MEMTTEKWQREGDTLFLFEQDGWRKGEPRMGNRFTVRVEGNVKTTRWADVRAVSERLLDLLNNDKTAIPR